MVVTFKTNKKVKKISKITRYDFFVCLLVEKLNFGLDSSLLNY